jgi:oligopeptide transport system substrate-binding protein
VSRRKSHKLMTVIAGASLVAVAAAGAAQASSAPAASGGGGELVDLGTFALGPPEHIDPALNTILDAQQVINALYDGLTTIDSTDPANPKVVPDLADYSANDDATVWTFTIHPDQAFSDGEPILPSTFQRSWERASDPDFAGDYAYLFNFIQGGAEKLAGTADTLTGVVADDDAMTLTVTLAAPYSNFPAVAGFQLFMPMPAAAVDAGRDYENQLMIGNGPYAMESPRTDEEIDLVKNDTWDGDYSGNTWDQRPDRIAFRVSSDADTSYNSLEAGEGDTARIPSGRTAEAVANWGTTTDTPIMGSYYFQINDRDPRIGGPDNLKLRQAISQAIDRQAISDAVYDGARVVGTGIVPEGIPGFKPDLCDYCSYDPDAAQAAFDEWTAAGNVQSEPIPIQFGAGGVHGDVVQLVIDNLAAIGIQAVPDERDSTTYFSAMADGACVICRSGWIADYPTYDNFMYDLFGTEALDGNNYGYSNPKFDDLVAQAKQTVDPTEQAALFNQAEEVLLNEDIGAIPLLFYRGEYAYNADRLQNFHQTPLMVIPWQEITITDS